MTVKTHVAVGFATTGVTMCIINSLNLGGDLTPVQFAWSTLVGTALSTLPDIDSDTSKPRAQVNAIRTIIIVIMALTFFLRKYIDTVGILKSVAMYNIRTTAGFIGIVILVTLGMFSKHRHLTHSILYAVAFSSCLYVMTNSICTAIGAVLGILSHDAIDIPNKKDVYLLWPIPVGFCLKLFKADGTISHIIRPIATGIGFMSLGVGMVLTLI